MRRTGPRVYGVLFLFLLKTERFVLHFYFKWYTVESSTTLDLFTFYRVQLQLLLILFTYCLHSNFSTCYLTKTGLVFVFRI